MYIKAYSKLCTIRLLVKKLIFQAELGKNLSHLHTILVENICKLPVPNPQQTQQQQQQSTTNAGSNNIDLERLKVS